MSAPDKKFYLGDCVYVQLVRGMIELSTDTGFEGQSRDVIYLEPQVFDALLKWAKHSGLIE
jgi:hypothetical protein